MPPNTKFWHVPLAAHPSGAKQSALVVHSPPRSTLPSGSQRPVKPTKLQRRPGPHSVGSAQAWPSEVAPEGGAAGRGATDLRGAAVRGAQARPARGVDLGECAAAAPKLAGETGRALRRDRAERPVRHVARGRTRAGFAHRPCATCRVGGTLRADSPTEDRTPVRADRTPGRVDAHVEVEVRVLRAEGVVAEEPAAPEGRSEAHHDERREASIVHGVTDREHAPSLESRWRHRCALVPPEHSGTQR